MTLEQIKTDIEASVAGSKVEILLNPSPSAQHSLIVDNTNAEAVARFLRDDPRYRLDFCSNMTGIDWPAKETTEKIKTKQMVDGPDGTQVEKDVEETRITHSGNYLEAVYHLYSMELKHGPVILRLRTQDRDANNHVPSLTPVWRSAEFQEREAYDLFGIVFEGHPDLRRILMWDNFVDYPMRKDYVEPDDYEYEPTAHDEVLAKAKAHQAAVRPAETMRPPETPIGGAS